jgi:hypothetical protein
VSKQNIIPPSSYGRNAPQGCFVGAALRDSAIAQVVLCDCLWAASALSALSARVFKQAAFVNGAGAPSFLLHRLRRQPPLTRRQSQRGIALFFANARIGRMPLKLCRFIEMRLGIR